MNVDENVSVAQNLEQTISEETNIALELAYYATD